MLWKKWFDVLRITSYKLVKVASNRVTRNKWSLISVQQLVASD